eukprot:TRINITY_DN7366_c0_g1_i1.p1 TRINITY_DN7366_c0_g1~~TRINITY_DN7366_c0_g1_i1.p1  ORF type:complete len:137 (+),score=8.70 TRINITY_DN7366_c0_g1_i1:201-611(+)
MASKARERHKVPLAPGCSLLDWNRLCQSGKDLSGTRGRVLRLCKDEVKPHREETDAWMILRGKVYNITEYMRFHPGGVDKLLLAGGRDGTSLFNKTHAWVNVDRMLGPCLVGVLVPSDQCEMCATRNDNRDDSDSD